MSNDFGTLRIKRLNFFVIMAETKANQTKQHSMLTHQRNLGWRWTIKFLKINDVDRRLGIFPEKKLTIANHFWGRLERANQSIFS